MIIRFLFLVNTWKFTPKKISIPNTKKALFFNCTDRKYFQIVYQYNMVKEVVTLHSTPAFLRDSSPTYQHHGDNIPWL
jgi:hypothetical protein